MANQSQNVISQVNLTSPVTRGFEVLKWPRRLDAPILTHELVKMNNTSYVNVVPLILKQTEVNVVDKQATHCWLKLNGVKLENFDAIAQATIGLTSIVESFGYNIQNISIKNWANTIIKNWVDKVPRHSITQELLFSPDIEDISDMEEEYGEFFGINPIIPLRLTNDLRSIVRFLDQRITYDNYCAVIRACWIGRKELGSYSRSFFDKLILLSEQCLDHTLYANAAMDSYNHQITNDPADWLEQMFMVKPVSDKKYGRVVRKKEARHNSTSIKKMQIMRSLIADHAQQEHLDNIEAMEVMNDSGQPSTTSSLAMSHERMQQMDQSTIGSSVTSDSSSSQIAPREHLNDTDHQPIIPRQLLAHEIRALANAYYSEDESENSDSQSESDSETETSRKPTTKLSEEVSNTDWSERSSNQGSFTETTLIIRRRTKNENSNKQ
jgi:hypothetical protein